METARKDTRDPARTKLINLAKRLGIDPDDGPLADLYPPQAEADEDLAEAYRTFVGILAQRFRDREPVVIVISGPEAGVGKSSLAIQLCQDVHKELGLEAFSHEHIVESAAGLEREYQTPGPGMYIYDEGSRGLLSRKGSRDREQGGLIDTIVTQRKNSKGLIICVVKKKMLDAIVNWGIANFTIFVPERGLAMVHRVWRSDEHRRSQSRLPYDTYELVPKFKFRNLDRTTFFRKYLELARERNIAAWRKAAMDPDGLLRDCAFCGIRGTKMEIARHLCPGQPKTGEQARNPVPVTERTQRNGGEGEGAIHVDPNVLRAIVDPSSAVSSVSSVCPKCGRGGLLNIYNYNTHVGTCKGKGEGTSPTSG